MLRQARALGDLLVVVLSHDAHNKKPNAVPSKTRQAWLRELELADEVIVGAPDSFVKTLEKEDPQVLVLGYDQRLPDEATARAVEEKGIEVVQMPWFPGKDQGVRE
jgi:glycerol-3-phosphate cytidylyltransferase-like family protein